MATYPNQLLTNMPPHHPFTCLYKEPISTPLLIPLPPSTKCCLSLLLAKFLELLLEVLASHLEEKKPSSCSPLVMWRGAPFGLHWSSLQPPSRRLQKEKKEFYFGVVKGREVLVLKGVLKEEEELVLASTWRGEEEFFLGFIWRKTTSSCFLARIKWVAALLIFHS